MRKTVFAALIVLFLAFSADAGTDAFGNDSPAGSRIKVGVYNGDGASPTCVLETFEALRIDGGIEPSLIGPSEIYSGGLDGLDVLVFPGGSGSRENNSLGRGTLGAVRDFVIEKGKGIVGICAGGYLVSDSEGYPCLHLIGAGTIDREHDKRGSAVCKVTFTAKGLEIFPEMKGYAHGYIQYHDGPVFVPAGGAGSSPFDELAVNESDVHCTGAAPAGITPGKSFLICAEAGKGRVFASAGHPEATVGMRWMVPRMARWVARRELVAYGSDVVRPGFGDREIMHSDDHEMELFWKLFEDDPAVRISALKDLRTDRYRSGFRWACGMIRDSSPEVRAYAAGVLAECGYTSTIPALKDVISRETDPDCRIKLEDALSRLQAMIGQSR